MFPPSLSLTGKQNNCVKVKKQLFELRAVPVIQIVASVKSNAANTRYENPQLAAQHEQICWVFSVWPGAGSLLGFLAVIAFLSATVRCRKIGKSRATRRKKTAIKQMSSPHFIRLSLKTFTHLLSSN